MFKCVWKYANIKILKYVISVEAPIKCSMFSCLPSSNRYIFQKTINPPVCIIPCFIECAWKYPHFLPFLESLWKHPSNQFPAAFIESIKSLARACSPIQKHIFSKQQLVNPFASYAVRLQMRAIFALPRISRSTHQTFGDQFLSLLPSKRYNLRHVAA